MDSVGVHSLGSAATQGGQDTSTEHDGRREWVTLALDGTRASRHRRTRPIMVACTVTIPHMLASINLEPVQHHPLCSSTFRAQKHRHGRISSFARCPRLCGGGAGRAIGIGEWALRSVAESTCHPSVGMWDREWLSCGCAPLRCHLCARSCRSLLAVLVGAVVGRGVAHGHGVLQYVSGAL